MKLFLKLKSVKQFMTPEVKTLDENKTLYEAIEEMNHYNISCIVVTRNNKPAGIITERDILRSVVRGKYDFKKTRLKEEMSSPLLTKQSNTKIHNLINDMQKYRVRRVVIADNDELKGIITQTDIVRLSHNFLKSLSIGELIIYVFAIIGIISIMMYLI